MVYSFLHFSLSLTCNGSRYRYEVNSMKHTKERGKKQDKKKKLNKREKKTSTPWFFDCKYYFITSTGLYRL